MIDFNIPLQGLDRASASLDQAASRIAQSGGGSPEGDSVDLSVEIVALLQAKNAFQTNAKVIQADNDVSKSLLNLIG